MIYLIDFLQWLIRSYILILIISAILSWLIVLDIVNRHNRAVFQIHEVLYKVTEPALRPIRRHMPDLGGVDISPIVLIILLIFVKDVVLTNLLFLTMR